MENPNPNQMENQHIKKYNTSNLFQIIYKHFLNYNDIPEGSENDKFHFDAFYNSFKYFDYLINNDIEFEALNYNLTSSELIYNLGDSTKFDAYLIEFSLLNKLTNSKIEYSFTLCRGYNETDKTLTLEIINCHTQTTVSSFQHSKEMDIRKIQYYINKVANIYDL